MFLPERPKRFPSKSLYVGVLLAMLTTLSLSFILFQAISDRMQKSSIDPTFDRFDEVELESGRDALRNGGVPALAHYMDSLNRIFGDSQHYLLDAQGKDLVSGEARAELLPPPPAVKWRIHAHGYWIISHRSADGEYWFAAVGPISDRPHIWTFLPYYFLVIGATGLLCWLASIWVVSPLHKIAASIALFGQGDLSVRIDTRRRDEIGQLGRSFNQMAERLQRLIMSERRLLGDISHEIRSPLARLKFAVKLARTSPDGNAALDRIERDVDRMTSLVADIVEINVAEGDSDIRGRPIRPVEIIREVVRDCAVEAEIRGCRIKFDWSFDGEILGNRELLRRAIENIVRNAIRYSPERSTIDISISADSCNANIVVRDYGPGVPEEMLARIFDPFFRVEEARDATSGGSGLGLSIAKRAVLVHHGTIAAENALPGLRVQIAIPLVALPLASGCS